MIPRALFKNIKDFKMFLEEVHAKEYVSFRDYEIINSNTLILSISKGKYSETYLYKVENKELYNLNVSDKDYKGIGTLGVGVGTYKNWYIKYTQPAWIQNIVEYTKSDVVKDFVQQTNLEDNPILIFNRVTK